MIANVGGFQRDLGVDSVLHVQIPFVNMRSFEVLCDAHDRAGACTTIDRAGGENSPAAGAIPIELGAVKDYQACGNVALPRVPPNPASRNGAQADVVVQRQESFPVDDFVDDAGAAADDGAVVAVDVPGKSGSRGKIIRIAIVRAADPLADLDQPLVGIEISQLVVRVLNDGTEL